MKIIMKIMMKIIMKILKIIEVEVLVILLKT